MIASSKQQQFLAELETLEQRYAALEPELELTVRDPELGVVGFVVVSNTFAAKNGPVGRCGKGGTRITPEVTLEEVKMLANIMTLKNAAAGLPLGGAKSGMRANPDEPGFEKKYRRFVSLISPVLVENGGIFGGFGFDIGARPEHPQWACDELGSRRCFTGKPLAMGGTDYDRQGIAGLGVAEAAAALLAAEGKAAAGASYAVQGLGAMGAAVVRYFSELGATLAFAADPRLGGCYRIPERLHDKVILTIREQDFAGTVELLGDAEHLPLQDILYQPVDVLFPCAVQNVITGQNAANIRAQYVVEGANSPCTPEAASELFSRGIFRIPDFIANPGGIIAAFVEMSEPDLPGAPEAKVEKAKSFTKEVIRRNVRKLHDLATELKIEPRHAGRFIAFKNIFVE